MAEVQIRCANSSCRAILLVMLARAIGRNEAINRALSDEGWQFVSEDEGWECPRCSKETQ